jgi:hypothetical protein
MAKKPNAKIIGTIKINVQREDRLYAINQLCSAINKVASALSSNPNITIANCVLHGNGIHIDQTDKAERTEIIEE